MSALEDMPRQAPTPETGDEKEVYAFYGLAAYTAQTAERGLIRLAVLLRLDRIQGASRATYDQEYANMARRTFGQILQDVSEEEALEDDLRSLLRRALPVRNRLTHHFFWDYAEEWFSEEGRLRMIRELQGATAVLSDVNDRVARVVDDIGRRRGLTPGVVEDIFGKLLADARQKYDSV